MNTLFTITDQNGRLLPVVPSERMSIVIINAYNAGYHNFTVKEVK